MKWLDHRARPHSRAITLTRSTIDSLSTATMAPGGGWFPVPTIAMVLRQEWIWEVGAAIDIGGEWFLADAAGACKAGLSHGMLCYDGWSYADEIRNVYGHENVAGWGLVDRTAVTAGDCLRLGTANPFPYAFKLSDGQSGTELRNNPTHPWDGTSINYAQYAANGWNLPLANGTGAGYLTYDATRWWDGIGNHQIGTAGEGRVLVYPYTWVDPGSIPTNFVGSDGMGGYQGDPLFGWSHSNLGARVAIAGGQGLGPPEWLQLVEDGATITGARIQVTVSDLVRRTVVVESTLDGTALTTDGTDDDDKEDCGVALMSCTRSGDRYAWSVLAVSDPGNIQSGKAVVVDGKDFVAALLADRPGVSHAYAVVPTPAVEGFANATNKQWLDSLRADIEMGYMPTEGDIQPTGPELGPKSVFPGGSYVKKSTARSVSWGAVSVGWFSVDFTVPGSMRTRTITAPWPIMGSPSLG